MEENQPSEQEQVKVPPQTNVLQQSGILDAYEYFLRSLCKNGLPSGNVFEFAAQQILKYEKKRKAEIAKKNALKHQINQLDKKGSPYKTKAQQQKEEEERLKQELLAKEQEEEERQKELEKQRKEDEESSKRDKSKGKKGDKDKKNGKKDDKSEKSKKTQKTEEKEPSPEKNSKASKKKK